LTNQLLVLVWLTAFGSAVGRCLPVNLAGLTVAALGLVLYYFLGQGPTSTPRFTLFGDAGATVSQIGITYNLSHLAIRALVLAVTAMMLFWLPVTVRNTSPVPTAVGWFGWVVVAAAVVVPHAMVGGVPMVASPAQPDRCVPGKVEICYFREQERYAVPVARRMARLIDAAERSGYDTLVPHSVTSTTRRFAGEGAKPGTAVVDFQELSQAGDIDLAAALVSPSWCPQLHDPDQPPPDSYWEDVALLAFSWSALDGGDAMPEGILPGGQEMLTTSQVASVVERFRVCDLDHQ
jgi:hypothetical protein